MQSKHHKGNISENYVNYEKVLPFTTK